MAGVPLETTQGKPMRRCRVCRTAHPKAGLQRWVKGEAGLVPDDSQKMPGRGYYSCSPRCAEILPMAIRKTGR